MTSILSKCRSLLILVLALIFSINAQATHIYGADFYYTYVSGNTYTVTLVVYGDCSGSAFSSLSSSTPTVQLYNGSSLISTQNLILQAPTAGVEVTPVCSAQLSNTNCVSTTGTIPGVKKFVYQRDFTVSGTSSAWKFVFTGAMGTTSAGRSTSITNISSGTGGGSIMGLEATLDNSVGSNSSPIYTTIPTPFFCINVPANNNPGAVDANGDLLSYNLVPGITGTSGTVVYNTGYSATSPLAVSTGSFSFSSTTGQLGFTPNLVQRSLVVFRVDEYRGSTLVGTSMREMTFVVLNNCSNNPPTGNISNSSGGNVTGAGKIITICKSAGSLSFNINPTDAEGDGITMTASGVPTGATFNITNNGSTSPIGSFSWNLAGATPGTYNMFINYKDDGCPLSSTQTIAYTINILPDPSVAFSLISPATCTKKARFNLTPTGSPSPWTITISQGTTTIHTFTGLTGSQLDSLDPGTYTVRVTNSNTCFKDTTITLNPPPAIYPTVSMVKPTCYGGNNGSITLNASGGVSPFTYALGSGTYSSTNVFTGLSAGSYTLHVKDAYDCIKDTTVQLLDPAQITLSIVPTKPKCNFFNSGAITVTAANGTPAYQYALGTGSFSSTNTFSGLFSGTYVIHVKDANNCTKDSTYQLIDSMAIHANAIVTNVLCYGDTTGAITLTGKDGASPYAYRIGTGSFATSGIFSPLPAGTHNFRVKDADSCYLDTSIVITQPVKITSTSSITNVTCFGLSNGSVTINAAGGISPYDYAIGSGSFSSTNTFSGLAAGNYTLHIKDANGCLKDTIVTITQPTKLIISNIQITEPVCNGDANGVIIVTGSGGTIAYSYAIDASAYVSSGTFGGLAKGSYTIHLKDANNCQVDSNVTMGEPTKIVPTLQVKQSTCFPLNDGRVIVSATGGVPAYVYAVGSGLYSSTNTFTPLAAGTYTFHIRDTRLCVKDTTITIIDSTVVNANYTISNVKCFGDSSGSISIATTSGKSPFTYAINTNPYGTSPVFNKLPVGSYAISIKDNLGCKKDTTLPITEPTPLQLFVFSVTPPRCYGFANGGINITGTGGTPPYSYAIDASAYITTGNITGLKAGTFTFHVKDANNCIKDTVITITQPDRIVFQNIVINNVLCHGDTSGSAILSGAGGVAPLLYAADNSPYDSNPVRTGFNADYHIVRIKDANNCYLDSVITITEPTKLLLNIKSITPPTCEGYPDGAVVLGASGGVTPYKFSSSTGAQSSTGNMNNLAAGNYTFTVKDSNNCIVDTNITLTGYPAIKIDTLDIFKTSCYDFTDGKILLKVSGGIPPLMYQMENRTPANISAFYDLAAGIYKIRIIDDKNCYKDTTVKVEQPDKLATKLVVMPNDCEGYDNDGLVKAEVTGGTKPYNYLWSMANAGNKPELAGIANGPYKVRVVDSNSCTDSASAIVAYDNCCKVFVPDAFTPNGDGRNDKAKILFKGDFTLEKFTIFNRFGQKVFETNILNEGWDGKFNGQMQDLGTFNYYIKGICGNGGTKEVEFKGNITLIK